MATKNRGTRLTKLVSSLKKHFKPIQPAERPLFESALYACLLENSTHDAAEEALRHLEASYFDWNEVRVSTRKELAKAFKSLNDSEETADRLKRSLQSIFESVYAFDLEEFKKQNLGQSVKQFTSFDGVTPFVVAYITQNGLSGHAIALNRGALIAFHVFDLISDAELKKGVVPGLERAVPKNTAVAAGSLIHQLGVEVGRNPYSPAVRKLLLAIDPTCKDRLPKRAPKPKPKPKPKAKPVAKKEAPAKKVATKAAPASTTKKTATKAPASKTPPTKKPAAKPKTASKEKPAAKKTDSKKVGSKKTAKKKVAKKKAVEKKPATKKPVKKKVATKKASSKKPAKKTAKKGAAKKVAKKKVAKKSASTSKKKRKPR